MHDHKFRFKSGMGGGARSKGEVRECDFDRKMFLHSDMFKLCLKKKHDITKLFLDTIMFLDKNNSRYKLMGVER